MAHRKPKAGESTAGESSGFNHRYRSANWSLGQRATLAITLEASAKKLGNVHPQARFSDMSYEDFLRSAIAIAPCFDQRGDITVGKLVYDSVAATQAAVHVNTNLGTLLLLAPVAIAIRRKHRLDNLPASLSESLADLRDGTATVVEHLTAEDSLDIYAAIRLAAPGGLGKSDQHDVHHAQAPPKLIDAMRVSAEIDQVARTYSTHFHFLFDEVVPNLQEAIEHSGDISSGIRIFQVRWLARYGDSLVRRKLGEAENMLLQKKATTLLKIFESEVQPTTDRFEKNWSALDRWMRTDGHRRNPGTTADLIAAGLFVLLCCQQ
jgi:triphosphoribosyl-dephospho-CoA synthase